MSRWIQVQGYFSESPKSGPFWVELRGERIGEIRSEAPTEDDTPILETPQGAYLLPLLSDTHAHVYMNPWPLTPSERVKPGSGAFEDEVNDASQRLRSALAKGIGFVRDMGDPLGINLAVKQIARKSGNQYPAYQVPGPAIHRPKKYGRFLGVKRESINDILQLIDELVETHSIDFIKVVSTGIVDFATRQVKQTPQYTADELETVVIHAESLGLKVASHCSGQEGIDNNIAAGIHFVEHAYFIRPDQRAKMRDKGLFWTPTFAPVYQQSANPECGWDDESTASMKIILQGQNDAIREGYTEGVRILAGTDAGSPGVDIGNGLTIELENLSKSLSMSDALKIATASNADACPNSGYTGRIQTDHPASFALYSRAPWKDLSILGKPTAVFQNGERITR